MDAILVHGSSSFSASKIIKKSPFWGLPLCNIWKDPHSFRTKPHMAPVSPTHTFLSAVETTTSVFPNDEALGAIHNFLSNIWDRFIAVGSTFYHIFSFLDGRFRSRFARLLERCQRLFLECIVWMVDLDAQGCIPFFRDILVCHSFTQPLAGTTKR